MSDESTATGLVKRPRGRPPKVTAGLPSYEDSILENPLFDDESDESADPFYDQMQKDAEEPEGPQVPKSDYVKPEISRQRSKHFERLEEIENELVKDVGRFIEHVDNAKPGVPYKTSNSNDPMAPFVEGMQNLTAPVFVRPLINELNIRSDGFVSEGGVVLDTGAAAQPAVLSSASPHDPASDSFMVCVNKQCAYREGCLRYRLSNRRDNKFPFHPSECRKDGIYISVNETRFTAFDPFDMVEATGVPTANRW